MEGISGSELYYLKILPALKRRGIECQFLCLYNKGNKDKNERFVNLLGNSGILVHQIVAPKFLNLAILFRMNKLIVNGKFDLVQSNLIHSDFWCALTKAVLNRKMKLVSVKHGYDETFQAKHGFDPKQIRKDLFYRVAEFSERFVDRSAAISDGLANLLIQSKIAKEDKIQVIPYGFDFSDVKHDISERVYRFSNHQLVIIGRLIPVKGHKHVFAILPKLIQEFPDVCLVIVGAGEYEGELKSEVRKLGIENAVRFEGFQKNIHDYLKNSDVALIPSKAEGFCAVILEAWHNKKPVISFNVPAPNEIIQDTLNGFLIPPFDENLLASKVQFLLENKSIAKKMGDNGYHTLNEKYKLEKMVDDTISFYQKV